MVENKKISCTYLKIGKHKKQPPYIPLYHYIDRVPQIINGYQILYASPDKCYVTRTTNVDFTEFHNIKEKEYNKNYLITLEYETHKEHYIYPKKVWKIIRDRYIKPMREGKPPITSGFLLYGSPGTGKTSMIEIIAMGLGLHVVTITPDDVLSRWVGEGEKNLAEKMKEAEETEPSILVMDDAEWLVRTREMIHADINNVSSLLSILLKKLQEWKHEKRKIIVAVATNVSPNKIDPALLRAGRLGRPIFIPLPDVEAIEILLQVNEVEKKLGKEKKEELKRKILSYGVNMADAQEMMKDVLEKREPMIEQFRGRGYIRPYNPYAFETNIFPQIDPATLTNENTRIYIEIDDVIGIPIMVSYLNSQQHSSILVKDFRYIDEIMATAEASRSVILVPTRLFSNANHEINTLIHYNARTGVIWIGEKPPQTPSFHLPPISSILYDASKKKQVILSILDYYDIKPENNKILEELQRKSNDELIYVLKQLVMHKSSGILKEPDLAEL